MYLGARKLPRLVARIGGRPVTEERLVFGEEED
jgi:hypothetical protein